MKTTQFIKEELSVIAAYPQIFNRGEIYQAKVTEISAVEELVLFKTDNGAYGVIWEKNLGGNLYVLGTDEEIEIRIIGFLENGLISAVLSESCLFRKNVCCGVEITGKIELTTPAGLILKAGAQAFPLIRKETDYRMQNFKPGQPLSIRLVTPDNKILVADAVTGYALTDNEREFIRICEPLTALSPNKREYRDICLGKLYQVKIADHEFCMPKGTVQFLGRGIYAQVVDPARPELASAPEEIVEDIWDARVINIAPDNAITVRLVNRLKINRSFYH